MILGASGANHEPLSQTQPNSKTHRQLLSIAIASCPPQLTMSPPPSPPSVSQPLCINSFAADTLSILPPGGFRGQLTTPLPMGSPPPEAGAAETNEAIILARLDKKRREIEADIEAFKAAKEVEYQELERELRGEQRLQSSYKKRKCENSRMDNRGNPTSATHVAAGITTSFGDSKGFAGVGQVVNTGTQVPQERGGSELNDTPELELSNNRKQSGFNRSGSSSSSTTSPPFEKELQAAGLFTPKYLPLLGNYFRQSPPLQDPDTSEQTSPQPVMPKLATIAGPSSRSGNTSPTYPLASSLKSSSGSSTGTPSKSGTKQKSPKRVTFRFEDENSVPSRSSPPSTKVHLTLEDENYPFDDEDGIVGYEGEDEDVHGDKFDETGGKVEKVENVTTEDLGALVGERYIRDELVVPTNLGERGSDGGPTTQSADAFNGLGIRGLSGRLNGMNGNKAGSDSTDDENGFNDDDDEGLFDLDETIPEVSDSSPPQRDYSALLDSQQPQTNDRLTASKFPMLPSFTPSFPPVPTSASESLLTFGKSPGPRLGLPRSGARRGSMSSSLSLSPFLNQSKFEEEPIASSLPNFGWKGADPPKSGFVPTPGGRFRRRSIVKYLPEDTESLKGKGKETVRDIHVDEGEEESLTLMLSQSPNATSLPMSISRHSPATVIMKSGSRSPKLPPQPGNYKDVSDSEPVPGRPPPKLRSSPLSETVSVRTPPQSFRVDTADILASIPTSFSTLEPEGSHEKNDSVSGYRRSSPFPSAYDKTPYRTAYAAEVAAAAALDDEADYGGTMESVVGGVDGRTGLDPDVSSFSYMPSSLGNRARRGSIVGGSENIGGEFEVMDPGRMSFGMRMAFESVKERGGR